RRRLELPHQVPADLPVLREVVLVLALAEPARLPVGGDAQPEAVRIDLLTHQPSSFSSSAPASSTGSTASTPSSSASTPSSTGSSPASSSSPGSSSSPSSTASRSSSTASSSSS